jgi:excisionase family DNA binding protein
MSKVIAGTVKAVTLPEKDVELAKQSSNALSQFTAPETHPLRLRLEDGQTGAQFETTVPGVFVSLLAEALVKLAAGQSVTLVPLEAEVSTQQAAEMLAVSRPYFVKLLERGEIPYRKVGGQRRVRSRDLLAYLDTYRREATAALDGIAAEMQALKLDN